MMAFIALALAVTSFLAVLYYCITRLAWHVGWGKV